METLWVVVLVLMLAITTSETRPVPTQAVSKIAAYQPSNSLQKRLSVFEKGNVEIITQRVKESHPSAPPKDLFIVSPITTGIYPILLFVHGTILPNYFYSDLFQHIASHGFIVVAPQIYLILVPPQPDEIETTASVANWLASNLQTVLPEGIEGDLSRLAVSGHSRGGKTAFALALGVQKTHLKVKISALIAIDPVSGLSKKCQTEPQILSYEPNSFNLSIPVTVIGTGKGNSSVIFGQSCAPNEVNHVEFYQECKEVTHFVIRDYGHNDMLNDDVGLNFPLGFMARCMCVKGKGSGDSMRRTLGGIVVAFLDFAYFLHGAEEFVAILSNPSLAPARLYPVEAKHLAQKYAQA